MLGLGIERLMQIQQLQSADVFVGGGSQLRGVGCQARAIFRICEIVRHPIDVFFDHVSQTPKP